MAIEGFVDAGNDRQVQGWVYDDTVPDQPLHIEIMAGEQIVGTVRASQFRPDLLAAGKGNGKHGFGFQYDRPELGNALRVRVVGKRWYLPTPGRVSEAPRYASQFAHSLEFGLPAVDHGFSTATPANNEAEIVARVMAAYAAANRLPAAAGDRPGDQPVNLGQSEVGDLIKQKDAAGLAAYLRDVHARSLTIGISQGSLATEPLRQRPEVRARVAALFQDKLVSLAEYLGILDSESPEHRGPWADNLHSDPVALAARIATAIGVQVVPPQVLGGLFGLRMPRGILAGCDLLDLYAALRLREVAGNAALTAPSVCELGGGIGTAANYAVKLGSGQYTLFDTPEVNVLQGYYLLQTLPERKIALCGEPVDAGVDVAILPLASFGDAAGQYDLLLNRDSLAEMPPEAALTILRTVRKCVRQALVSINHEARGPRTPALRQNVVRDLVRQAGGFTRQGRSRHWLRAGYVEEVFAVDRPAGKPGGLQPELP